jgi:hypothetical protein
MLARTGHNSWCEEAHQFRLMETDSTRIRQYQKSTGLHILPTAAGAYLVSLFEDTNLAAIHAKRTDGCCIGLQIAGRAFTGVRIIFTCNLYCTKPHQFCPSTVTLRVPEGPHFCVLPHVFTHPS